MSLSSIRRARRHLSRAGCFILCSSLVGTAALPAQRAGAANVPAAINAQQPTARVAPLVFDGVTVVDVEQGKLVPDQQVVIVGTHIQAVGASGTVSIPKNAQRVDARQQYLIPGLWDMHYHTAAAVPYLLLLANGVTGIRDAWGFPPLDTMLQWRREILAGTRIGPVRQILTGAAIDEAEICDRAHVEVRGHICVSTTDAADGPNLVQSLKIAGVDMIKLYNVQPAMYFTLAAAARQNGLPFGGHLSGEMSPLAASDSGASIVDHLNAVGLEPCFQDDVAGCRQVAERFRQNGTWYVPTMMEMTYPGEAYLTAASQRLFTEFTARAREFWTGKPLVGHWLRPSTDGAARPTAADPADSEASSSMLSTPIIHTLYDVGMPVLAGTDGIGNWQGLETAPSGFGLHVELAMSVLEGMTPLEALRSATLNPARMLHATDSLGTVAAGKLADLVLLDANPLADITNTTTIRAVVANGRYFDRAALDSLLAEVQRQGKTGFTYWREQGRGSWSYSASP